jgi:hypothetical protein
MAAVIEVVKVFLEGLYIYCALEMRYEARLSFYKLYVCAIK